MFGGLRNSFSGSLSSHEMTSTSFLSQMHGMVRSMTNGRMYDTLAAATDVHTDEDSSEGGDVHSSFEREKGARLGDTIIASVKEAHPNGKEKKGKVVHGVVVRAAMQKGRCDGSEVKFDDNAVVLVDKQGQPIGTRVFGPVPHELRQKKHVKILTLAGHIA
ncbi:unnamed protein product [Sphenostylis stenocarpa]|uniref:Mitochondrial ribosomal protein L14 n=1 Tax=Sphenostylis stenocarpa TaxID=92480 RepID=A0AA86T889_9FABA|nr:unnamed protein product [Sphenostylis stenocarpa]